MGTYHTVSVADGSRMRIYAAAPAAAPPTRGILVFQEAFGVNAHIRDVAERFARLGYLAAAPELYHRTGAGFEGSYEDFAGVREHMQALSDAGLEADIEAAHGWLLGQGVKQVVAAGFCLGGREAMRAAAKVPLAAAASFYGANLAGLKDLVAQIAAPLLVVWGDQDTHIPVAQRDAFANLLREHKKSFVESTFSDAGHGFMCDARSAYHPESARIGWALLTTFLERGR